MRQSNEHPTVTRTVILKAASTGVLCQVQDIARHVAQLANVLPVDNPRTPVSNAVRL
jgi:hypothetical protein